MPKNRYQRNTIVNYGNVPNYEAHAWGQVEQADLKTAKIGKDLASLALKSADAIQENEAQIAGMLAGQQPDMKLQSGLDLLKPWASTFNKAALAANVAGVQNDIRANLGRMEVENQMDPDGYAASVKGYAAGLLPEVHPQVRGEAQIAINNYASRASTRILARAQAQQSKLDAAEIVRAVQGKTSDALNAARDGDLKIVETATKTYFATLDLGVEEGLLDPVKVEQVKSKFQRDTDAQIVLGEFGRTLQSEGIESAEKVIKDFKESKDLPPDDRDKLVATMETLSTREQRRQNQAVREQTAAQAAIVKQYKVDTDNAVTVLKSGTIPSGYEDLLNAVHGTELAGRLDWAMKIYTEVEKFAAYHPAAQEALLTKLEETPPSTAFGVELKESYEKAHQTTTKLLKDWPIKLGVSLGIIPAPEPIQLGNPDSVALRMKQVRKVESYYDIKNLNPLGPQEIAYWSNKLTTLGTDQRLMVLNSIVSSMGENSIPVLEKLGMNNQPVLARAGELIGQGQADTARLAVRGLEYLKELKGITPTGMDDSIRAELKGVFNSNPRELSNMTNTIKAVYTAMMAESRAVDFKALDLDLLGQVVTKVTGGILGVDAPGGHSWEYGGRTSKHLSDLTSADYIIQAPAFGVNDEQFEDWLEGLTADNLDEMGGTDMPYQEALEMIPRETLIGVGQGKYLIFDGAGFLHNKEGKAFELTWPPSGMNPVPAAGDPLTPMPELTSSTGLPPPAQGPDPADEAIEALV